MVTWQISGWILKWLIVKAPIVNIFKTHFETSLIATHLCCLEPLHIQLAVDSFVHKWLIW